MKLTGSLGILFVVSALIACVAVMAAPELPPLPTQAPNPVAPGATAPGAAGKVVAAGPTWLDETVQGAYDITGTIKVTDAAALRAGILFGNSTGKTDGDYYKLSLTAKGAQFYALKSGKPNLIGWSEAAPIAPSKDPLTFTLQRRDWEMSFILNNRVIARAYDATLTGGKIATMATGAEWADVRTQPVGDIVLRDDFVRGTEGQSPWETVQGNWAQQTLREDPQASTMQADKSANAFCYLGRSTGKRAVAVGGYWFWDAYTFKAAVEPEGASAIGIVVYYQDPKNYLAFRWTAHNSTDKDGNQAQLVLVSGGDETVLASHPGGFNQHQWYALRVNACGGLVQAFVDDEVVLQKRTNALGQGQAGFLVEGAQGAYFDDAEALDWEVFSDDLSTPCPGKWVATAGNWQFGVNEMSRATGAGEAMCVAGRAGWRSYTCSTNTRSGGGQGLVFSVGSDAYGIFRWAPAKSGASYAGKAQVVLVKGGVRKVIAESEIGIVGAEWHRTRVESEDGYVVGYVDDRPVVRAFDASLTGGRVGLYADGGGSFRRAYLSLIPPKTGAHVVKEFTDTSTHPEMAEWASTRAPWIKPTTETDNSVWWTKGDYYGDQAMHFAIPSPGARTGTLKAVLCADPAVKDSGYVLTISATAGTKVLAVRVSVGGKEVAKADVTATGDPCPVVYERRNGYVVVEIDGKAVVSCKG